MTNEKLIKKAIEAQKNSYSPYSKFPVGAALLTKSNKVFLGTNIENAVNSVSCCAERSAFYSAISNGEKEFTKIAIIGNGKEYIYPCGVCRQSILELAPNIEIICAKNEKDYKVLTINDLLPNAFKK